MTDAERSTLRARLATLERTHARHARQLWRQGHIPGDDPKWMARDREIVSIKRRLVDPARLARGIALLAALEV